VPPPDAKKQGHRRVPEPHWAVIHRELKRKHVTLTILWEEYIAAHPLKTLARVDLLILDDWGLDPLNADLEGARRLVARSRRAV